MPRQRLSMRSLLMAFLLAWAGFVCSQNTIYGDFGKVVALLESKEAIEERIGKATAEMLQINADPKVRMVTSKIAAESVRLAFGKRLDGPQEYLFLRIKYGAGDLQRRIYRTDTQLRLISAAVWDPSGESRKIPAADAERELHREIALWIDMVRYRVPGLHQ